MKNHRTLIWILGAFMLMLSPVKGQYFEFVQITDNAYDQKLPAIDGDYIVYEDYRNGSNSDIYLYNRLNHTEIPLASDPGVSSIQPDISGNIVFGPTIEMGTIGFIGMISIVPKQIPE